MGSLNVPRSSAKHQLIPQEIQRHFFEICGTPGLSPLCQPQGQPEYEQGKEQYRARQSDEAETCRLHGHQFFIEREASEGGD